MNTSRRKFLKKLALGGGLMTVGGVPYCFDEPMDSVPLQAGKVLCDLHAHPSNNLPTEEIVRFLGSPGMVGLAQRYQSTNILTYEEAVELVKNDSDFSELDEGQLAKYREGYFARAQEVSGGKHHFLALGCRGGYLPDQETPSETIDSIHGCGGIAIFNHPYTIPGGLGFRLADEEERETIERLLTDVDEVEVHNAFNINYLGIGMRESNRLALSAVESSGTHVGTAASDCHGTLDQAKICGIYVDEKKILSDGMSGLIQAIVTGDFQRYGDPEEGPYISRMSFTTSIVLPRIFRKFGF